MLIYEKAPELQEENISEGLTFEFYSSPNIQIHFQCLKKGNRLKRKWIFLSRVLKLFTVAGNYTFFRSNVRSAIPINPPIFFAFFLNNNKNCDRNGADFPSELINFLMANEICVTLLSRFHFFLCFASWTVRRRLNWFRICE